jgi:polysaccharide deacetylase 2 family uncharacterized protein YibQ
MPWRALFVALGLLLAGSAASAQPAYLSLIIDDLGNDPERDRHVLELPGPVAMAILPDAPYATSLARQAHRAGRTILVHMPMAPADGPYAWLPHQPPFVWLERLEGALRQVPHASGLNNHMGSRMTTDEAAMNLLMPELQRRHMFFVDSRTTAATVAAAQAQRINLASLSRDLFLDHDSHPEAVAAAFQRGVEIARRQGSVVMIGHPHASTLAVLQRELPKLAEQGIEWIDLPMMIAVRGNQAMPAHGHNGVYR